MSRSLLACLLLLATQLVLAQEASPRQPDLKVPVQTEVVRVDVIVTEKGAAKLGLAQTDFEVLEDGQPQRITGFQAFVTPVPASEPGARGGRPAPDFTALPSAEATPRRHVVLAVDDIHIDSANLIRLKKTLDRFLEREIPKDDLVALVTTSGSRSHELTDDRHALRQAAARLTVQDRRPRQIDVPFISEHQAERIMLGDPDALTVAVDEIRARRQSPNPAAEARSVARAVLAEAIANSRTTLETLDNVVRGMAKLAGRKVVVLLSDGFLTGLQIEGRAAFDIRRIADAGTRAGVIVYGLDSRGLQAAGPGSSAASRGPVLPSSIGAREQMSRAGELAAHDAMNALAAGTGGFLEAYTNNFAGALRKILADTESYYLLAYEPTNPKRDGAFRNVEVRLPRMRGVRIRHRKGYFGPDAAAEARTPRPTGSAGAGAAAPPDDPVRQALLAALASAAPHDGLPVRLSADFVSLDATTSQLVVSSHVDLRGVSFARTAERRLATLDVAGAVYDEAGAVAVSLPVERAALEVAEERQQQALERGLEVQRTVPVKPGRYRVAVAARDEASAKIGTAEQWVEIPDLGAGKLTLSGLFFMKEGSSVQAARVYRRQESLDVQFFVYAPAGAAVGALVSRTELWRDAVLLAASRPEGVLARDDAGKPRLHTRKFKLAAFEPGSYEVRIVVTQEGSGAETSGRAAFKVE
jgi:VWFA-related protein